MTTTHTGTLFKWFIGHIVVFAVITSQKTTKFEVNTIFWFFSICQVTIAIYLSIIPSLKYLHSMGPNGYLTKRKYHIKMKKMVTVVVVVVASKEQPRYYEIL